jgi:hypothetical protein
MEKQITERIMGILLLVFFVVSLTAASVSAVPQNGGISHNQAHNLGNCKSVCEGWYQQKYCDHGHWIYYPKHGGTIQYWICDHWSTRRACSYWAWKCTGPTP